MDYNCIARAHIFTWHTSYIIITGYTFIIRISHNYSVIQLSLAIFYVKNSNFGVPGQPNYLNQITTYSILSIALLVKSYQSVHCVPTSYNVL